MRNWGTLCFSAVRVSVQCIGDWEGLKLGKCQLSRFDIDGCQSKYAFGKVNDVRLRYTAIESSV